MRNAFFVPFRFRQLFRFCAPQVVDTMVDTRRLTQSGTHFYGLLWQHSRHPQRRGFCYTTRIGKSLKNEDFDKYYEATEPGMRERAYA